MGGPLTKPQKGALGNMRARVRLVVLINEWRFVFRAAIYLTN